MPQSSSVTASVITAIAGDDHQRHHVLHARRRRASSRGQRAQRAKASTSGQRAPGASRRAGPTNDQRGEQRHDRRRAEEVPRDDVPNRALRFGVSTTAG